MEEMMNLQKFEQESFLEYAERLLSYRKEYDLDKAEIYALLYGEQVSSDHARKCLTILEKTIEQCKQSPDVKEIHKELRDNDLDVMPNYKSTIELNKDGSQTSDKLLQMSETESKDPEYLLNAHGYDVLAWDLVSARNNIWNVYSKQDGIQTLYSSKIVVKPVSEYVWNAEAIAKLFDGLQSRNVQKQNIMPQQYEKNGRILVVPIADLHYNLLSDAFVTGNEYNVEIAERSYRTVIEDVISRNQNKTFEKVVFVVGNDFVNADNLNNTTTKGTPQDCQMSWFSVLERLRDLLVYGIDRLASIAPVDIVYVPSNHDLHTMFGMMLLIKAWYRNDDRISVDGSPLPRKYYRFGNTLLVFSHDMKVKNALQTITTEGKTHWGDCTHIICMLAHLHQAMIYDKQGYLEVWRLPTVSGWSRWTNSAGYVQSDKKNQAFVVDSDRGIIDIFNTVL